MHLKSVMKFALGCLLAITAVAIGANAQDDCEFYDDCDYVAVGAPEVDPGMMGTAIGVLTGGYLIVSSRRRSK